MSAAGPVRNGHPVARLWWWLLPSVGFFAYPEDTTWWERTRWSVPYWLWRLVNLVPVDPFAPVSRPVCRCDECEGARAAQAALSSDGSDSGRAGGGVAG